MRAVARLLGLSLFVATLLCAADLTGIWMGQVQGRNGEKQDVAFQFQSGNGHITGVLFGDEFDLPVQELHLEGSHITFSVTNVDYYGSRRVKTIYTGTLTDTTLELTREQASPGAGANAAKPKESKQVITLKRIG